MNFRVQMWHYLRSQVYQTLFEMIPDLPDIERMRLAIRAADTVMEQIPDELTEERF